MKPLYLLVITATAGFLGCADRLDTDANSDDGLEVWRVTESAHVEIGGQDDRPDYILDRVMDATRLSDGRIAVANGGTSEILFYDSAGMHLQTIGGEGDGPGEMRGIFQLERLADDSLLVFSSRPGLTWFSPEGEYLRSQLVDVWAIASVPCRIGESNWHVLPDGSFLTVLADNFGGPGCPPSPTQQPWRQSALLVRTALATNDLDTLAILPGTERNSPNYRVYGKELALAIGEERIYASDTGGNEILVLGFEGDTLGRLPVPFEARPIPPEAKTQDIRRWTARDGTEQVGQAYLYPDSFPRVGRLIEDAPGNLWVMAYPTVTDPIRSFQVFRAFAFYVDPQGDEWMVLNRGGDGVARVRTPPGVFPLEIGEDYILGLKKDELDVQSLVLHGLSR